MKKKYSIIVFLIAIFTYIYFVFYKKNIMYAEYEKINSIQKYHASKKSNTLIKDLYHAKPLIGYDNYHKLLQDSLRYPIEALKDSIEGNARVHLHIQKDGTPSIYHIYDFGYGSKQEAERLIHDVGGKWIPAINKENGDTLTEFVMFAISFKLDR